MNHQAIDQLIRYGIHTGLIPEEETVYTRNLLLDILKEDSYVPTPAAPERELCDILGELTDAAIAKGLIPDTGESRDLFDTRLMNALMPRPAQVRERFFDAYAESPEAATRYYYTLSQDSNYIRRDRIRKDRKWVYECEYGPIDITINLSKPEKDPRDIAAARDRQQGESYPLCALCAENEGYAGRIGHPARENHRLIPLTLDGSPFFFQYSPYVYYNEHCIVFNREHIPMHVDESTIRRLVDFVRLFPHYFIGSNAGLPIVGGSILSHDHFQGGRYTFAMERASVEESFTVPGFEDVSCGLVRWPMSVLRLQHRDPERIIALAVHVLDVWHGYSDESVSVYAETDGTAHNAMTPIVRRRDGAYEIDLVLRNNLTTPERPMGLFHPREAYHHIKRENIGLIEVMGLAVLPSRLDRELALLEQYIVEGRDPADDPLTEKHAAWVRDFLPRYDSVNADNIRPILEQEVGRVFLHVLEDAGVFKRDEAGQSAFRRFLKAL